jgi:uncharacterized protein
MLLIRILVERSEGMGNIVKGYGLLLISLLIMGAGISLVTLADLGTTAISSLPYVLSFVFPLSFGAFTALMNITFVFIQILITKKEFPKEQYLQFLVGPILGLSIDLNMYLFSFLQTSTYLLQVILLLSGCILLAFSTVLQLEANVVNNAGEGLVKVLAMKEKKKFGDMKLIVDVSIVVVAVAISFLGLGEIRGIREGTIVSALIVGPMVKFFRQLFDHNTAIISQRKAFQKE